MFFYDDDSKILLINKYSDKKCYCLDLEKGIITDEYVTCIIYFNKFTR